MKYQHDSDDGVLSSGPHADAGIALDDESVIGERTKIMQAVEVCSNLRANTFTD